MSEVAEVVVQLVWGALDWLLGGKKDEGGEPHPCPVPETLYEERRPPPSGLQDLNR